jgi:hypothetical protein
MGRYAPAGYVEMQVDMEVEETEARRVWPHEWEAHWPHISTSLDGVMEYWKYHWTKKYIYDAVMRGEWQAWGFGKERGLLNVIVLTRVSQYPANMIMQIPLAFGNSLDKCLPLLEATLVRFAIANGCQYIEFVGRPGWERKVESNLRKVGVLLRLDIEKQGIH